jgi:hypothetical protein
MKKGRSKPRRGELNGRAKLSVGQVNEIRATYQERRRLSGRPKISDLSKRYGVSTMTIWEIGTGKHWKSSILLLI